MGFGALQPASSRRQRDTAVAQRLALLASDNYEPPEPRPLDESP